MNINLQIILAFLVTISVFATLVYQIFFKKQKKSKKNNALYNAPTTNTSDTVADEFRILEENNINVHYLSNKPGESNNV